MNGLGKTFQKKNPIQKIESTEKTVKNQSEIAACEQKTTSEKANGVCSNTVLSLYFKCRAEKFYAAKQLAFSLNFPFRRDQNHHSNLTSKIVKMCEQILKKHSRTSPEVQFKEFSLTKKTRPKTDYEWIGKTI